MAQTDRLNDPRLVDSSDKREELRSTGDSRKIVRDKPLHGDTPLQPSLGDPENSPGEDAKKINRH